jgi:hypothetical protein
MGSCVQSRGKPSLATYDYVKIPGAAVVGAETRCPGPFYSPNLECRPLRSSQRRPEAERCSTRWRWWLAVTLKR